MLLEFTVGNFLSFKEKKTLSLSASSITEYHKENVVSVDQYNVLKGAVIYGANSSGKSNFIKAIQMMKRIVSRSFFRTSTVGFGIETFLLDKVSRQQPSYFEVVFLVDSVRYRYGFEVDRHTIKSEWLFEIKKTSEKELFIRVEDNIEVKRGFSEGEGLEERTRENALFLSVVDQFNGSTARKIMIWFDQFIAISALSHIRYKHSTIDMLKDEKYAFKIKRFFTDLDLGFKDITILEDTAEIVKSGLVEDLASVYNVDKPNIKTIHEIYNEKKEKVGIEEFDLRVQESSGTNKIFNLSGPIFDVLDNGGVLILDELDASLHPLLTIAITKLFNSTKFNPNRAQLIFATHDTNLLNYGNYRRDQVYFVEKDFFGASDLYSLAEYKSEGKAIRKDASFEKDYIQGRYGAIPFIGDLSNLF